MHMLQTFKAMICFLLKNKTKLNFLLFKKWLHIICKHCPKLDKFCLFQTDSWFSSAKPHELKGLAPRKA